jgi:hypothetical protein
MREFVGIDLGHEPVPGETTILHIRDLLERHGLGKNCSSGNVATPHVHGSQDSKLWRNHTGYGQPERRTV